MKAIAARNFGGEAEDYDIDGKRVYKINRPTQGLSYAAVASQAIKLGGIYNGEILPEDIHENNSAFCQEFSGNRAGGCS